MHFHVEPVGLAHAVQRVELLGLDCAADARDLRVRLRLLAPDSDQARNVGLLDSQDAQATRRVSLEVEVGGQFEPLEHHA